MSTIREKEGSCTSILQSPAYTPRHIVGIEESVQFKMLDTNFLRNRRAIDTTPAAC